MDLTADRLLGRTFRFSTGIRVTVIALGLLPNYHETSPKAWGIRLYAPESGAQWVPLADFAKGLRLGAIEECA